MIIKKIFRMVTREKYMWHKGQVMMMAIVMMGGVLLSAAAIAGLLMVFQIRESNDSVNSTRAFFAADAALEWEIYNQLQAGGTLSNIVFDDPYISADATSSVDSVTGEITMDSEGYSGHSARSLESVFFSP